MKALLGQTLLGSLSYELIFYLTNSPVRNKQNKPRKQCLPTYVYMCVCICACVCTCLCVCACMCWRGFSVAERVGSGYCQAVYLIEKPVVWSREVGSISERCASFLQLCIFPPTRRYIDPSTVGLHALTQTVSAGVPHTCTRHPFEDFNENVL